MGASASKISSSPGTRKKSKDLFGRLTAQDYQKSASEFALTCSVADLLRRWCAPQWEWTHFPAGEKRPGATGARLQRMGLQPGWPDFILLSPEHGAFFLELKKPKTGRMSWPQKNFEEWCEDHDYPYARATTIDEAQDILGRWGALRMRVQLS